MGFQDSALYQDMTPSLLAVSLFSSLGAFSFGYDNNWWGGVIGATQFGKEFGSGWKTLEDGTTIHALSSSDKSTGTALGTAGIMIGCMIAPFINERYGRRISFVSLGVIGVIGTLIQACSTIKHSYWTLIVGKIIVNISVGIASAVTGLYQADFGTFLGNAVMFGVHLRTDSLVWMLPIGLQFIFPAWLVQKGKLDEAHHSLRRLRGPNADDADIDAQVEEIRVAYEHEKELIKGVSFLQIFRGSDLRRTLIAIGMQCLQQAQGISFMLLNLGFENTYELLVVLYACKLIISFVGFYLPDRVGRRPLVLLGSSVMLFSMLTVGGVASVTNSKPSGPRGRLTLGAVFMWILIYSFTWSPMPWTIASEVSSNRLREKTLASAAWSGFGVGLISNLVVPYIQDTGYGNLQGQIAYLWGGFSVVALFFCFFFVPELKGRSLEDLDELFYNKVPTRKFAAYKVTPSTTKAKDEDEKEHAEHV
ncbi:general substrate transporter [Hymenopellis radicata]|nr:general substrate transporter [Hymenopellis radicata]